MQHTCNNNNVKKKRKGKNVKHTNSMAQSTAQDMIKTEKDKLNNYCPEAC